ncbi:MAG: NAD(P)H-dependent oxidoreductase [Veillonella sp.]|nr:NAD(P)H-dependent oxidoreductase [Veillonella sp.]
MSKYEIENVKLTAPKLDRNDLEYAMTYRYACKKFDSTKKISDDDWNAILNAARLSPTSLGFEAYQLLVIQNPHVVVFLARKKADLEFDSSYIRHIQEEVKQLPAEVDAAYREKYAQFTKEDYKTFESERAAFDWASKQTYIVMANMMTMAAYEGLDSCALEGFNQDKMTALLGDELGLFDTKHFGISVMAAFGYRDEEPHRNKTRIKIFTRRMLGP